MKFAALVMAASAIVIHRTQPVDDQLIDIDEQLNWGFLKNIVNIDRFFSAAHEAPAAPEPEESAEEPASFLANKNPRKTLKHPAKAPAHEDQHVDVAKEILDFDSSAKAATKNYNPATEVHDSAIIENPDENHEEKVVDKKEEE